MAESMQGMHRTHRCTELSNANIGEYVTVMGWVQKRRNLGGMIFVDLRDRTGLLQLIFDGAYAWGWTSMLLDYILAYGVLGFAGLFAHKKGGIFTGTVVGCVLRFIVHFVSGVTIYRIYEPTQLFNIEWLNPYLYSAAYNGSYMALDMVICLVIFAVLYKPLKKYFMGADLTAAK